MKKKIKWFTLIELIVVISIIAVISSSWIVYFTDFSDDLKIKNSVSEIKSGIESLDNKIKNREIFDYELTFSWWGLYYFYSENIFNLSTLLKLNRLDLNSWIWEISFSWASSWTWIIRHYAEQKFKKEQELNFIWIFTWSFLEYQNYKINWSFSGETLNNININYFDKERFVKLLEIHSWSTTIPSIKITNILWKKIFWNDENINKITLTFENIDWKREDLEIIK